MTPPHLPHLVLRPDSLSGIFNLLPQEGQAAMIGIAIPCNEPSCSLFEQEPTEATEEVCYIAVSESAARSCTAILDCLLCFLRWLLLFTARSR
jgi:hypothetical protein